MKTIAKNNAKFDFTNKFLYVILSGQYVDLNSSLNNVNKFVNTKNNFMRPYNDNGFGYTKNKT